MTIRQLFASVFSFLRSFAAAGFFKPLTNDPPVSEHSSEITVTFYDYVNSAHGPAKTAETTAIGSVTCAEGDAITFPTIQTKDWTPYYTFLGWSVTPDGPVAESATAAQKRAVRRRKQIRQSATQNETTTL